MLELDVIVSYAFAVHIKESELYGINLDNAEMVSLRDIEEV